MSFERFKFWKSTPEGSAKGEESFIGQATNIMNIYLKKTEPNIQQFEDYLANIPQTFRKNKTSNKQKGANSTSLKPQLLKKCYEVVSRQFFEGDFNIGNDFFTRNKKVNRQKQTKLHEDLDQVEVCLFNQIGSRFDEILSVLRTIESLQCIVEDNQSKLRHIRSTNLSLAKKVAYKQCQVVKTVHKKRRLQQTLQLLQKVKKYQMFEQSQKQNIEITNQSAYYNFIQEIKAETQFYNTLSCTPNVDKKIDEYQGVLKKSFSDSINDSIFKYITEIVPYDKKFWGRMQYKMDVFEDDRKDPDNTVILDESVLVEQEHVIVIKLTPEKQDAILQNLKTGWSEGQYTVGGLKAKVDSFLKALHTNFLQDFRNFCVQMCQRFQKVVDNPSLTNILSIMTINFCVKVFQYFNDAHKNMLQRLFSVVKRCMNFIISQSLDQEKTISQKQKLTNMLDGLINTEGFIFKIVAQKMNQILEMKYVQETTDLKEFKTLIDILQAEEQFITKKLKPLSTFQCPEDSFLYEKLGEAQKKINLACISNNKSQKLRSYLARMHKYNVETELKDDLENEIWQPIDIPTYYYDSLHYLISGQSLNLRRNKYFKGSASFNGSMMFDSSVLMDALPSDSLNRKDMSNSIIGNFRIIRNEIIIEGKVYKVTKTILLIIEMLEDYLSLVQSYPILKEEVGVKIYQLLRSYNTSTCQLIIHAGAVVLGKIKSKNITAKHLALSSLCLSFILYLMDCILKRYSIHDSNKLIEIISEHLNETIKKLNSILMGKVQSCLSEINLDNSPSKGTQKIVNNTKILHDILIDYYQKPTLRLIFTKQQVRLFVDKVATLKIANRLAAEALKDDITFYFNQLRFLNDLIPEFSDLRVQAEDVVRKAFEVL